jgi:hypothetical protein
MRRDLRENIARIVRCLQDAGGWLWFREIARRTGLHHKTVSRLIDKHLSPFVEEQVFEALKLRMVRLKPEVYLNGVLKFIRIKERLKG